MWSFNSFGSHQPPTPANRLFSSSFLWPDYRWFRLVLEWSLTVVASCTDVRESEPGSTNHLPPVPAVSLCPAGAAWPHVSLRHTNWGGAESPECPGEEGKPRETWNTSVWYHQYLYRLHHSSHTDWWQQGKPSVASVLPTCSWCFAPDSSRDGRPAIKTKSGRSNSQIKGWDEASWC